MSKIPHIPEPNEFNTLIFGEDNPYYTFMFTHDDIAKLDRAAKRYFEEAVDRFASLMIENLEKMEVYRELENDHLDGIKSTIKILRKANDEENRLSDSMRNHEADKAQKDGS